MLVACKIHTAIRTANENLAKPEIRIAKLLPVCKTCADSGARTAAAQL
jgi:hypothetical protein